MRSEFIPVVVPTNSNMHIAVKPCARHTIAIIPKVFRDFRIGMRVNIFNRALPASPVRFYLPPSTPFLNGGVARFIRLSALAIVLVIR